MLTYPMGVNMAATIPYQRTRAVLQTRELLMRLKESQETPGVPDWLRAEVATLLVLPDIQGRRASA